VPAAQVLLIQRADGPGEAGPGEHAADFLPRRGPRGVVGFGEPPETVGCLVQAARHERVVDVLEPVHPAHRGLVLLEHGDGAGMLAVLLQGRDELAEHRRGLQRQVQRAGQRPDRQVAAAAVQARVPEVVQHPRIPRARAVLGVCRRRGGLGQVIEPGQPGGLGDQACHLAQRQCPAIRAQLP
jgi:hypothetical protein